MDKNKLIVILSLIIIFSFLAIPAQAQKDKITLDIKGMDIAEVLKIFSNSAGMNMAVGKNVSGRISLFIKDVDIWDAFEIIILANDLAYEKRGDIINVMTQKDYELLHGLRFQENKKSKVIQLKYAKVQPVVEALNQMKSSIGKVISDENTGTLALIDLPVRVDEMVSFIESVDLPIETRVFTLNYAKAEDVSVKIQELVTKDVGCVKIDQRTNKIAATDYVNKLDELANLINAFDEKPAQVLIDAQIIEINPKRDQFAMGVDWDYWLKKNVRLVSSLPAPTLTDVSSIANKLSFGVAAGNATVAEKGQYKSILDLMRVIGETKILSSPRIMTLNNQEAKILVGTKEAYITSSTSQSSQTSVTSQSVNFVDVGIKLYVTPTINTDGFVTMKIKPEVSSAKRTDITSEGKVTQIPIVTTSESETTIMIKDGTTIIIAGLKKDKRDKEVKKNSYNRRYPPNRIFL